MNLERLAQICGVSVGTVSKVFSDSPEISEKTRKKVIATAKENGCYEKYNKSKYQKRVIAVVCPEIDSAFYSSIVTYIDSELKKIGATMALSLSNFNSKTESEIISWYLGYGKADGIIVIEAYSQIKYDCHVPIVVMNANRETRDVDSVNTDFLSAFCDGIKLFIENGHKKIAYIGEQLTKDKQDYFIQAMNKFGLSVNEKFMVVEKTRFETAGFSAMEKLLSLSERPTAIFAAYDYMALGAIQCLTARGYSVPDDFSFIGVDDIPFAAQYNISLTSVKSNTKEICDILLKLLLKKIDSKYYCLRQNVSVRSELIVRNSVKHL